MISLKRIDIKNRFLSGAVSLALGVVSILGVSGCVTYASEVDSEFRSGKLVVKTSDENILENAEICSSNGDTYLLDYDNARKAKNAYEKLKETSGVRVSPEMSFIAAADSNFNKKVPKVTRKSLEEIDSQLRSVTYEGENSIALIDSGVSIPVTEKLSVLGDDGDDKYGHGTNMAETILEMDKDAKIISIKALSDKGVGSVSSIYSGIMLAISRNVKVINLSVVAKSIEENEIIRSAINEALSKNIIVVGAAGNNGENAANYIPGGVTGAIIVGACDKEGTILPISNFGETVDWYVNADTTSYASAKLSGFINKNCQADGTLNGRLMNEQGKGLIFPVNYNAYGDAKGFVTDDWEDIDLKSVDKEALENYAEGGGKVIGIRSSKKLNVSSISVMNSANPNEGEFTPAAWNYATVVTNSYFSGGNGWISRIDLKANDSKETPFVKSGEPAKISGYINGYSVSYTPGALETSAAIKGLGYKATNRSLNVAGVYSNGYRLEDYYMVSSNATSSYKLNRVEMWTDPATCLPWLYSVMMRVHITDKNYNRVSEPTFPRRVSYYSDDHCLWYEEGGIGSAKGVFVGPYDNNIEAVEMGLVLRDYKIYYQPGENENGRILAGEGKIGSEFNFVTAENEVSESLDVSKKTFDWDYSDFNIEANREFDDGEATLVTDSFKVIPKNTTAAVKNFVLQDDGYGYYEFTIKNRGTKVEIPDAPEGGSQEGESGNAGSGGSGDNQNGEGQGTPGGSQGEQGQGGAGDNQSGEGQGTPGGSQDGQNQGTSGENQGGAQTVQTNTNLSFTLLSEETGDPVSGAELSLENSSGRPIRTGIVTDSNGNVMINGLSCNSDGSDASYTLVQKVTKLGYELMRPYTFTVSQSQNLDTIAGERILKMKRTNVKIDSVVSGGETPKDGIVSFLIKGTDVANVSHEYYIITSSTGTVSVPAGSYTVSATAPNGFTVKYVTNLGGATVSGQNVTVNTVENENPHVRYTWNYTVPNKDMPGALKVNRFRK